MGRKPKYKNDRERKEAAREATRRSRAKKRGEKPTSWVKTLESKLDDAAASVSTATPDAKLPTPTSGNPFEGLPTLDLPTPPSESGTKEGEAGAASAEAGAEGSPSAAKDPSSDEKTSGKVVIDVEQICGMVCPAIEKGVQAMADYAGERGYIALGHPFPMMAAQAARIILNKRAEDIGMDEEEYAAWVLGGVVGVNGVQCFRAYKDEKQKAAQAAAKAKPNGPQARTTEPGSDGAREHVNGTHHAPPVQQSGDKHALVVSGSIV